VIFGDEVLRHVLLVSSALLTFLSALVGFAARYDPYQIAERTWKWFIKKRLLVWFVRTDNGLLKVVAWVCLFAMPMWLISEWHWLYTNPGKHSGDFLYCGWGAWQRWTFELAQVSIFVSVLAFLIARDCGALVLRFAKDDTLAVTQTAALWLAGYALLFVLTYALLPENSIEAAWQTILPDKNICV